MNWMRIVDAVDAALPDAPGGPSLEMRLQKQAIAVGAAYEMSVSRPSENEMAEYMTVSRTLVNQARERWFSYNWKDRYNWLRFVEGRLARETHTVDAALL